MSYNLSFEDTVNTTTQWISGINNSLDGLPSVLALILVWLFVYMSVRSAGNDGLESWLISSFGTTIIAGLLLFLGFISWQVVIVPLIMLLGGFLIKSFN